MPFDLHTSEKYLTAFRLATEMQPQPVVVDVFHVVFQKVTGKTLIHLAIISCEVSRNV